MQLELLQKQGDMVELMHILILHLNLRPGYLRSLNSIK